jgi:hypothetical protein
MIGRAPPHFSLFVPQLPAFTVSLVPQGIPPGNDRGPVHVTIPNADRGRRARRTFEKDRERDSRLVAQGFRVIRVTWRRLNDEPYRVLTHLVETLALATVAAPQR